MRILLLTLGSHGDIHPFIALGRELIAHGHEALLSTNPHFAPQAAGAGVPFAGLCEDVDLKETLQTPGVMDASRGPRVVLRDMMVPITPDVFARTRELIRAFRPDACVIHPICFGSSWACEVEGVPCVPVCLAPLMWMGSKDLRVYHPWRWRETTPRAVAFDEFIGRLVMRLMMDGPLNRLRKGLNLPKRTSQLRNAFLDGELNLGLWSPHLRPPCEGDPIGGKVCGFAWFDAHHMHQADNEQIEAFLNDGDPPIVFTLGSAAVHVAKSFYQHAAEAARLLSRRAILLVGRQEYVDALGPLPQGVKAFTYAPFSTLLPRCLATVHHGGIGSTAQAMRAGRPTVIVPMAHDQFDNAARARRLGLSASLPFSRITPKKLAAALASVIGNPQAIAKARAMGERLRQEDGASNAVIELERFVRERAPGPKSGAGSGSGSSSRSSRAIEPASSL